MRGQGRPSARARGDTENTRAQVKRAHIQYYRVRHIPVRIDTRATYTKRALERVPGYASTHAHDTVSWDGEGGGVRKLEGLEHLR